MTKYVAPAHELEAFNCPRCGAYSHQHWTHLWDRTSKHFDGWQAAQCSLCKEWSVWEDEKMVSLHGGTAELPHPDMPESVKGVYGEAREIVGQSPRGAAALLRLGVQTLCKELGEGGENVNSDIGELVKKGLPSRVQQALDVVRVVGNNAVHPGQIDLDDSPEIAAKLFGLLNFIVDQMITQPNKIEEMFEGLPEGAREAVDRRDNST